MSNEVHFQGKSTLEHLIEARKKGAFASAEIHGAEISGWQAALFDAMRDTSLVAAFLALLHISYLHTLLFLVGWVLWKTTRSASLGWMRLHRVHRLIEEERFEIEHHREQEREELLELYAAKGFSGPLLSQVVDVLMADDNRLLQVMLEEELNLPLQSYEHPLQQASGAFVGSLLVLIYTALLYRFFPLPLLLPFLSATLLAAKQERATLFSSCLWNIAFFLLCLGTLYFGILYFLS